MQDTEAEHRDLDKDFERFGTRRAWANELGINPKTVLERTSGLVGITARDSSGRIRALAFLSETQIRNALAKEIELKEHEIDKNGLVEVDGMPCIAISRYAECSRVTYETLQAEIEAAGLTPVRKARSGNKVVNIYPKYAVDKLPCIQRSLKAHNAQINDNGVVMLDGKEAICIDPYARTLGIKRNRLEAAIKATCQPVGTAYNKRTIVKVYDKCEVDNLDCVKIALATEIKQISSNGTVVIANRRCVALNKYAKNKGLKEEKLKKIVKKHAIPIFGYVRSGTRTVEVYDQQCVDAVIPNLDTVDANGIVYLDDGEAYVSLNRYAKSCLDIHPQTLIRWVNESSLTSDQFAISGKKTVSIFKKVDVDQLIALTKAAAPIADKTGFFYLDGQCYGNHRSWARRLGINFQTLRGRLRDTMGITGRIIEGKLLENGFYSEAQVSEACSDLLFDNGK